MNRTFLALIFGSLAVLTAETRAQSPAFSHVQPVQRQTIRDFPYHKYRVDERFGPVFPPPVIIFRSPQSRPSDYPYTYGYGSSPFIRRYGGAGSTPAVLNPEP